MSAMEVDWDLTSEVALAVGLDKVKTSRVISLIDGGNTLPFIARYRKEATGNLEPDIIRRLNAKLTSCREVIDKIEKSFKMLSTKGVMTPDLKQSMRHCKTLDEISSVIEPFKTNGPKTLAAKAKAAGLEPIAFDILKNGRCVDFLEAARFYKVDLTNVQDIQSGVLHIIADLISKNVKVTTMLDNLAIHFPPLLETSQCPAEKKTKKPNNVKSQNELEKDLKKFQKYLNMSTSLNHIAPHKILAINRAEERKIIRVKLSYSNHLCISLCNQVAELYLPSVHPTHHCLIHKAFDDAWKRLLQPSITRKLRSKVTSNAHELSLGVFSDNLRRLLMTAPLRYSPTPTAGSYLTFGSKDNSNALNEKTPDVISSSLGSPGDRIAVIGLDPGWRTGCKWAAVDPLGSVIETGVIHITTAQQSSSGVDKFVKAMKIHDINTIALGNGQACRQTEQWLAQEVSKGTFMPLKIRYTIVSEAGASVYSASKLADNELPNLDVSLRGAVSIARRLQDPLAEMVKIEPRHLGVGMYQHDLPMKRLEEAVNELLEECISFVGVDVNTAQQHVLARVAGLSETKSKEIIKYRSAHGRFRCRQELLKVKGIGQNTFAQCAGFLRVKPNFCNIKMDSSKDVDFISLCSDEDDVEMKVISGKKRFRLVNEQPSIPLKRECTIPERRSDDMSFNPLDQTSIHPDSYQLATSLVRYLGHEISDVGCLALRSKAHNLFISPNRDSTLSQFQTEVFGLETIRDILHDLSRILDFDERENQFLPIFRSSIISFSDLHIGLQVTGRVENVTTFGAFIDIGLEETAFVPISNFPKSAKQSSNEIGNVGKTCVTQMTLHLGDRIKALVANFCPVQKRICLRRLTSI